MASREDKLNVAVSLHNKNSPGSDYIEILQIYANPG